MPFLPEAAVDMPSSIPMMGLASIFPTPPAAAHCCGMTFATFSTTGCCAFPCMGGRDATFEAGGAGDDDSTCQDGWRLGRRPSGGTTAAPLRIGSAGGSDPLRVASVTAA